MARLLKILRLSRNEIGLLACVLPLVSAIRLGLWVLPFPLLRRLVARAAKGITGDATELALCPESESSQQLEQLVWAVQVASRLVPQASCLTQALAVQVLLNRRGYPAVVRIGVAKSQREKFQAHAWVESYGQVIIGGTTVSQWTPLTTLEVN